MVSMVILLDVFLSLLSLPTFLSKVRITFSCQMLHSILKVWFMSGSAMAEEHIFKCLSRERVKSVVLVMEMFPPRL